MSEELEPAIEPKIETETITDQKYYSSRKLTALTWSPQDAAVLTQIRAAAEEVYLGIFAETLILIEEIYDSVKEEKTGESNWGLLTTKHLENHMLSLAKNKISIALQLKPIQMEALFSKFIYEDAKNASYINLKGPHAARDAQAELDSFEQKYSYFFRFYLYTMCESLSREIDGLVKNLSSVLFRRGSSNV